MENTNKYQRGKIYKLVNDIDDEFYIGSTCEILSKRKAKHKCDSKRLPDRTIYKHLNEIGWDTVDIILIENYPCNSKEELHARERYWIEELKPNLNKYIPTRTIEEYREQNKDKKKHIVRKTKIRLKNGMSETKNI
jgi:group I intron endonuclease